MKKIVKISSALLIVLLLFALVGCQQNEGPLQIKDYPVEHETKFGGVYIKMTIDDFNALGFAFGDSVDITFSNGFSLQDIPYFNGYYVDVGEPLLVGYPGYPYIRVGYNNGDPMWDSAGLTENDVATVVLNKKGKYLAEQRAMDIHYTDEQGDKSDAVFANFRVVNVGRLKENILYRSASPVDNQHKRAAAADRLAQEAGIRFILNLSDDAEELVAHTQKEDFNSPYALSLIQEEKVIPLSMSMAFKSETFSVQVVRGLYAAAENEGPYLVHCVEGKDRTGFVCMVLEALAGATYEEIVADYMVTYDNYYGINKTSDPERYNTIKQKYIDVMLQYLVGENVDITTADYATCAENFLDSIGMMQSKIDDLKANLLRAD